MTTTPLQVAKLWEQVQSRLASSLPLDERLIILAEFWNSLRDHVDDAKYDSYVRDFLAELKRTSLVIPSVDFTITELSSVVDALDQCHKRFPAPEASQLHHFAASQLMRLRFYVGDIERGLESARGLAMSESELILDSTEFDGLSEFDSLRLLTERASQQCPKLQTLLADLLAEWELERSASSTDSVNCLFVDDGVKQDSSRGRLRVLQVRAEIADQRRLQDEVTFQMHVVGPDDPLVGAIYDSLAAVRQSLRQQGKRFLEGRRLLAHIDIVDSGETFTGDSIGLGAALAIYSATLQAAALRNEQRIAAEVAVTGVIDSSGNLLPANPKTIGKKVERAFFSLARYVVVPAANLAGAREQLEALRRDYPRRRLIIIGAASVAEVLSDHNVVRSERVCMGEFVVRRAGKYARMSSIQIPVLLLLSYFLLCLIQPKAWIFFDASPVDLQITDTRISALNNAGQEVWTHDFGFPINPSPGHFLFGNLDDDKANELVFTPRTDVAGSLTGKMFVFDQDGAILFERECWIPSTYPSDTVAGGINFKEPRCASYLKRYKGREILVTILNDIYPARAYIKFWTTTGDLIGWLIYTGTTSLVHSEDLDADGAEDFIFAGFCNHLKCVATFVVDPAEVAGVSPPYGNPYFELNAIPRATAKQWVFFKPSRLLEYFGAFDYQSGITFSMQDTCDFNYAINEGTGTDFLQLDYQLGCDFRVSGVMLSDSYAKRFRRLVQEGLLPAVSLDEWADSIRGQVLYFQDGDFVTERQLTTLASKKSDTNP